jgi:hypothetical protein
LSFIKRRISESCSDQQRRSCEDYTGKTIFGKGGALRHVRIQPWEHTLSRLSLEEQMGFTIRTQQRTGTAQERRHPCRHFVR